MKKTTFVKALSFMLCVVLIAAVALLTTACNDDKPTPDDERVEDGKTHDIGDGKHSFVFEVADIDGNVESFNIKSDLDTVGEALQSLGLVEGDEGAYGLYVKTVNGITADYDKDGTYWGFYINGELAPAGIDQTEIVDGTTYRLEVTKG